MHKRACQQQEWVVVLCELLFFDWQNERVDQRCTEEGLLVVCDIFCQLRLPNYLETGLLLLFNNKDHKILLSVLVLSYRALKSVNLTLKNKRLVKAMIKEMTPSHNTVEETKIHLLSKRCKVQLFTITKWFKKFCLGCKNLDAQARCQLGQKMEILRGWSKP